MPCSSLFLLNEGGTLPAAVKAVEVKRGIESAKGQSIGFGNVKDVVGADDAAGRALFFERFAGRHTPGFDVQQHLQRVAVVNQTTLLMNETLGIIEHLREVYRAKFGDASRVGGFGRRDNASLG